ncbi:MAG: glycosyltransferase [Bacilli bacterium]|nr:glycosyltransferase [Bacilli bacterium]
MKKNIVVLIPALNPKEDFYNYTKKLSNNNDIQLIIIDDGSKEELKYIFKKIQKLPHTVVLTHPTNQGKGRAIKTGLEYYINHFNKDDYPGIITADSDGQHKIEDVLKIGEELNNLTNEELILGTRYFNQDNVPFKSRNGNKITTLIFKLLYGKKINDTQTGLRGITYEFAKKCLTLKGERFEYEINMLIKAVKENIPIKEQIIETIYYDNNKESHFKPLKDAYKIYKIILMEFILFILSGLSSKLLEIIFYKLIYNLLSNNIVIPILSRFLSSIYNYNINKEYVFKSNENHSIKRYYLLFTIEIFCYYIFSKELGISSKIINILLFLINYQLEQRWVYKKKD